MLLIVLLFLQLLILNVNNAAKLLFYKTQ